MPFLPPFELVGFLKRLLYYKIKGASDKKRRRDLLELASKFLLLLKQHSCIIDPLIMLLLQKPFNFKPRYPKSSPTNDSSNSCINNIKSSVGERVVSLIIFSVNQCDCGSTTVQLDCTQCSSL
ncbi:hypothetical protein PHYBLDRAFT_172293 [Phycomyces blakesleeanus NRRL 1555(-)]|uniref:Uncharacterized protein n=1 Tax=Phycomyces blakesleeanus (strain ATCC 8743b / DSM 1359 / FGSC 10004 / NBRC 33097 / NRRL 1555) TaxID=763407 RepID=A0A167L5T1_PHYB8|nr:hypothetical protein PHYBLDRAFT_172293 [Phycomyces blakesleeanus NRRL 1555(-)]OAD69659.1 hypothetical protein PHYBLDRAFT_172293 [Phycomyces blakesleeanus NRRL 1555(-)]|eukprot:XP_018287699.1 hypothetical protein PHYBLDRAFT_172293 [Phycomyces blakesleeanus NRRL 1555(-)]